MSTTVGSRPPLVNRATSRSLGQKWARTASGIKRPRSPEIDATVEFKRQRAAGPDTSAPKYKDKERRHTERAQKDKEFKDKYSRAFPTFTFHFDLSHLEPDTGLRKSLEARIVQLGGVIEDFFSKDVTHLITNQKGDGDDDADKENNPKSSISKTNSTIKSPSKSRTRVVGDDGAMYGLITKAVEWKMKTWSTAKLDSVLSRCLEVPMLTGSNPSRATNAAQPMNAVQPYRSLARLLQSERVHGSTERDPTQKRHDFTYFSRGSYWVLVEDMQQELATIAAHEYEVSKGRDSSIKGSWPVAHCHPHARGPFIPFDDRERRRWERNKKEEMEQKDEQAREQKKKLLRLEAMKRKARAQVHSKGPGDLRRSASMNNLHRRGILDEQEVGEALGDDNIDSANASGYLGSGAYVAASGNSVSITSTTGTTSTTDYSHSRPLPPSLRAQIGNEVTTSRRLASIAKDGDGKSTMGPPTYIPTRSGLRKSRSTNSLRLPKREEGSKPGYCESCRVKFDDFKVHVKTKKHDRYANNAANFSSLDFVLSRIRRRTRAEIEADQQREEQAEEEEEYPCDDDDE
ncbi:Dfp1/Him1, central region-domain-containing protein [Desarmillaria tabescens]|uniref:Dfp1/Him1, central region-domain-containing protein n=1 Tax=Armillaria tabescens TaxID=1929756 RepID=A0AA39T3A7_ARMTA|nr:Dfp1/Him1, central region-domain-containing protein [Desarmillaria tabescens]KAK0461411.1 Dfp1/Him1, central region-domain-containing protein [Desarmillaria tabescens]